MAKKDSVQNKLEKVRRPRVHLKFEVEKGDAIELKELPFIVGVTGDFSGMSEQAQLKLRERKFINVDRENIDDVMKGMAPRAVFRAPNKLTSEGGELAVDLQFTSMNDFRPEAIVQNVEPLRKLLEARTRLSDLRNKLAGNDKLEDILSDVLSNTEKLAELNKVTEKE
jgi:type VI secretion system protein ImpB